MGIAKPLQDDPKEKWRDWLVGLALLLIWALIFWGLRLVLGEAPHIITVKESLESVYSRKIYYWL